MITKKDKTKFLYIVFFIMGVVFLGVGIGLAIYYFNISKDSVNIVGTIVSIKSENTMVGYEYDGQYYTQYINEYSSTYYIGKKLELLYSLKTEKVYTKMTIYGLPIIFSSIGLLFTIIGIIITSIIIKNNRFLSNKANYIKKVAKVINIKENHLYSYNNKYPNQLICNVNFEGENLIIKSPNFWDDIYYQKNYVVDVYFKNKKKYIVDLESYRKDELFYEMEEIV